MNGEIDLSDLFRIEAENHAATLSDGVLALEKEPNQIELVEPLMRAAHSLKGAARIVNRDEIVQLSHTLEDTFVSIQRRQHKVDRPLLDALFYAVEVLSTESLRPTTSNPAAIAEAVEGLLNCRAAVPPDRDAGNHRAAPQTPAIPAGEPPALQDEGVIAFPPDTQTQTQTPPDPGTFLRVAPDHLNLITNLSGSLLVESRKIEPLRQQLLHLGQMIAQLQRETRTLLEQTGVAPDHVRTLTRRFDEALKVWRSEQETLDRLEQEYERNSEKLYAAALRCRMRPFQDSLRGAGLTVRQLAHRQNKEIELISSGEQTLIDREVMEHLQPIFTHLLRNAIDHGIEPPEEREALGKTRRGTVKVNASVRAGELWLTIEDDGRGINLETVRRQVVERGHAAPHIAEKFSDTELIQFLFLPGFTLRQVVTEISGRGIGLDAVKSAIRYLGGDVSLRTTPGQGTTFTLRLPVTLSVVTTMLIEVGGEPFAFPIARLQALRRARHQDVTVINGQLHLIAGESLFPLFRAAAILGLPVGAMPAEFWIMIINGEAQRYAVIVDGLLGVTELTTKKLPPILGKIRNLDAASVAPDGRIVLIIDPEDFTQSIRRILDSERSESLEIRPTARPVNRSRILVVDDSLTVRELQRKLLATGGYDVEVAVDGVAGWNLLRNRSFDLVVTDIDMPRMDGIELVRLIRNDPRLLRLPVVVVSYKDREEDKRRGLEAGADHYLTKSSFHDDTLLAAVRDLIGEGSP
jgi:two-component system sensor histidine kinase and response regulator WspE